MNSSAPEKLAVPVPRVTPVVLSLLQALYIINRDDILSCKVKLMATIIYFITCVAMVYEHVLLLI